MMKTEGIIIKTTNLRTKNKTLRKTGINIAVIVMPTTPRIRYPTQIKEIQKSIKAMTLIMIKNQMIYQKRLKLMIFKIFLIMPVVIVGFMIKSVLLVVSQKDVINGFAMAVEAFPQDPI